MAIGSRSGRSLPLAAVLLLSGLSADTAPAASLAVDQTVSREGYYQLRWEAESPVRLVEASSPDFDDARVLYQGSDTARVVSGKPDGTWYYRLEPAAGGAVIGEPIAVTVLHHPLGRALAFFATGAIVFAATLGLILFGRAQADERSQ